jgi:hypothetical protein
MRTRPCPPEIVPTKAGNAPDDSDIVIDSVTLRRLMEEVRTAETTVERSYNRTYNRHNR